MPKRTLFLHGHGPRHGDGHEIEQARCVCADSLRVSLVSYYIKNRAYFLTRFRPWMSNTLQLFNRSVDKPLGWFSFFVYWKKKAEMFSFYSSVSFCFAFVYASGLILLLCYIRAHTCCCYSASKMEVETSLWAICYIAGDITVSESWRCRQHQSSACFWRCPRTFLVYAFFSHAHSRRTNIFESMLTFFTRLSFLAMFQRMLWALSQKSAGKLFITI